MQENTVRKTQDLHDTLVFLQQKQRQKPRFEVVDTPLLAHIEAELTSAASTKKGSNRQRIGYKQYTIYQMIQRGVPDFVRGLKSLLDEQDYTTRKNGLLRLYAVVRILRNPMRNDSAGWPVTTISQVSEAMIAEEIEKLYTLRNIHNF